MKLISKGTAGDDGAFRQFYNLTSSKLFGVAMRILKDTDKAADAVQDAYLQVWRNTTRPHNA
ncbi:MAG: sigma factor [Pseudomonadota bacterium]